MGRCVYCDRPAGFLRKFHTECHRRHRRATLLIPQFFLKFLESELPVDRFQELLKGAAEASFIKPQEFDGLVKSGISNAVNSVLLQRLLTKRDIERILQLAHGLGPSLSENVISHETLVKVNILCELEGGKIPNQVIVVEPLPIELRRGETVIWVFNHVRAFRLLAPAKAENQSESDLRLDQLSYYPTDAFSKTLRRDNLQEESTGDLVVTNYNIYFLINETRTRRIPISRITTIRAYADGIHVACETSEERTRTFVLSEPWFAANLIVRLIQTIRG